jgi:curli production assembly/transport component CsgF
MWAMELFLLVPFRNRSGIGDAVMFTQSRAGFRGRTLSRIAGGLAAILFGMMLAAPAMAQELVYKPINPSFGGDSFNSSHLLGIANAQNDYKDPRAVDSASSQSDLFLRQLQSRLLSSLASQVSDAIFGENPQDSGRIVFGDQIIEFTRGLESVRITIIDTLTGGVTEIEIPLLYAGGLAGTTGETSGDPLLQQLLGGAATGNTTTGNATTGTSDFDLLSGLGG